MRTGYRESIIRSLSGIFAHLQQSMNRLGALLQRGRGYAVAYWTARGGLTRSKSSLQLDALRQIAYDESEPFFTRFPRNSDDFVAAGRRQIQWQMRKVFEE